MTNMNKKLYLPIKIERKIYSTETVWTINFAEEPIEHWCLVLCLLKEDLIEFIQLTSSISHNRVIISKNSKLSAPEKALSKSEKNTFYLELC